MLIDTHAHLDEDALTGDLPATLDRAREGGLGAIITIGTTAESSRRAVELASKYPMVFAAVGIHPNYAATATDDDWATIESLASHERVKGIGETGLDRYWDHTPIETQIDYFRRHLELSRKAQKPFIVHCREAEADVMTELRRDSANGTLNGVMHSFCASPEAGFECIAMGMHLSFAGMLTYKRNEALRGQAAKFPRDRLLVETDAPYLAPAPHRGKRNEPAFVKYTAQCLAEACGIPLAEVAAFTTANAIRLFQLPDLSA